MGRNLWRALGLGFVALGFIGAVVPLMPTTVFLILAAGCFARSSPRLERWLMQHPRFGPALRAWRMHKAIPRRAKLLAVVGMAAGFTAFELAIRPPTWLALLVGSAMAGCAAWMISRPSPPPPALSERRP